MINCKMAVEEIAIYKHFSTQLPKASQNQI